MEVNKEFIPEHSLFLTPPLSNESVLPSKTLSRLETFSGNIPVLNLEDDNEKSKPLDILQQLFMKSLVHTVCSRILDRLTDKELVRMSHVSKTWYTIVRYVHMKSGRRVSRYLRKSKKAFELNKENIQSQHRVLTPIELPRTPLSSTADNIPRLSVNSKEQLDTEVDEVFRTPISSSSKELYKHCPTCQSPARTAFRQTGHCSKCNLDFCIHCFYTKEKHSPTCQVVGGSGVTCSPRKLTSNNRKYSLGSKENRSRLKRL